MNKSINKMNRIQSEVIATLKPDGHRLVKRFGGWWVPVDGVHELENKGTPFPPKPCWHTGTVRELYARGVLEGNLRTGPLKLTQKAKQ